MTLRILHCIYDHRRNPWVGGGGAVRAHEINRRLAARGHRIHTLCGGFPGAPPDGSYDGVRYEFTGHRGPYPWSRIVHAARVSMALRAARYDVAVLDVSAYSPVVVPRRRKRPIVGVVHHLLGAWAPERWGPFVGGVVARSELRSVARLDRVAVISEHTRRMVLERLPGTEIRVIGNAVEDPLFEVRRSEADPPYILFLGRLDLLHKGVDIAIRAFDLVSAKHPDLRLRIAGTGKDAGRVRELAASAMAADRIDLHGACYGEEKRVLLAGAAVVVMPSRMEPWGIVAAEAMAAGAPLVCTRVGGLPEVTGDDAAVLVPPEDPESLATAVGRLLNDPDERRALGERGRRRAAERFRWDAVADAHERFLLECADHRTISRKSD